MLLTRRRAVATLGAAALWGARPRAAFAAPEADLLGAARDADGGYRVGALDAALGQSAHGAAPVRLHAMAVRPDGAEAVAIARRPGDLGLVFDGAGDAVRATFKASGGRRFSGHGAYRDGGRSFVTSEIDAVTGEGWLVLRSVADRYVQTGEWPSAGVGPHDVVDAGSLLVAANGAKEPKTDPGIAALGRTAARSNVALLHPSTGAVERLIEAGDDLATLSLRHVAAAPGGLLVAAQDTESGVRDRPLVAWIARDRLRFLDVEPEIAGRMGGSVCSLVVDRSGRFAAASCPKGGVVVVYDLGRSAAVGFAPAADVCGVAPDRANGGFIATTGLGEVLRLAVHEAGVAVVERRIGGLRWDNHVASRPVS